MVKLVTDSSADLPREYIDRYDISVVPLTIHIDGKEYLEGVDLQPKDFAEKMLSSKELPQTSQPSPQTFANMFKTLSGKGQILCLTISSGLSGTYQSACIGKDMSGEDVTVFDTLAGSLAHGLQLIEAAKLAEQDFLCYLAGITPVKPIMFLVISSTARIPALVTSTYIGANLQQGNYAMVIIVSVIACLLLITGFFMRNRILAFLHSALHNRNKTLKTDSKLIK